MAFVYENVANDFNSRNVDMNRYLEGIEAIVLTSKAPLEGNVFYIHHSLTIAPEMYNKQLNVFWAGKKANAKICEIGFNAGHSAMLMLLGRDKSPIDFTIFDIGFNAYTKPCLEYMQRKFPHVKFEYIEGDSAETMPKYIMENNIQQGVFDIVHVDGGHYEVHIRNDMKNADRLVKQGGLIIVDDTNCVHINDYVEKYLATGNYKEVEIANTSHTVPHRIIQRTAP